MFHLQYIVQAKHVDLQQWLIAKGSFCNTLKVSIFWWWRASQEERREEQKWGAQTVHMRQRPSDWAKVRMSKCERERERETVVMINARLPPLCSSEWLQQKAQNNIPDYPLCFSPSLVRRLSHSLCVSAGGERLRSQLCRGYTEAETGAGSTILGSHQQVRVGGPRLGIIARSSIIQLSRPHCSRKGKKKIKEEGCLLRGVALAATDQLENIDILKRTFKGLLWWRRFKIFKPGF